jgi:hypothetical protein
VTDSVDIQVADAIVAEIQAAATAMGFPGLTVERSYADVARPFDNATALRVDVVPWDCQVEQDSHGTAEHTIVTDIVIRQKFGPASQNESGLIANATVDPLPKLRQDICELLMPAQPSNDGRLTNTPDAAFDELKIVTARYRPHWREHRQFTGWIRVTYLWSKAPG